MNVPPTLFPVLRISSIRAIIFSAVTSSGQRAIFASTASMVTVSGSMVASISCTWGGREGGREGRGGGGISMQT